MNTDVIDADEEATGLRREGKGMQSNSAEAGIVRAWFLVPAILLLACAAILYWHPLDGPAWEQIKSHLAIVHNEKEKAYLAEHGLR